VISVQLWGPSGVNSSCQLYVSVQESRGQSVDTLAWLEQHSICEFHFVLFPGCGRDVGLEMDLREY
jgi:hypothetical protein